MNCVLQRKCTCGGSSASGGTCEECAKKKLQRKVAIGAVDDPLEREADAIAAQVMSRRIAPATSAAPVRVQRAGTGTASPNNQAPASVERVLSSPGEPMKPALREDMEARFGQDFSSVRVHTDSAAAQSAAEVHARAYTVGRHVVFGAAQYSPGSASGRGLLAHELVHVMQQEGGGRATLRRRLVETQSAAGATTKPSAADATLLGPRWRLDAANCTLTMRWKVQVIFDDKTHRTGWMRTKVVDDAWTAPRKTAFKAGLKSAIESTFNSNGFKLVPRVENCTEFVGTPDMWGPGVYYEQAHECPCKAKGLKPLVQIEFLPEDEWSVAEDWEVEVLANAAGVFVRSANFPLFNNATLDEADLTPAPSGQVPAVHEFGHSLGLDHPGKGQSGTGKNDPGEYSYPGPADTDGNPVNGPTDLMGQGSNLRPFYFARWANALPDCCGYEIK